MHYTELTRKIVITFIIVIAIAVSGVIAAFAQPDANNYVTIQPNQANLSQSLIIFDSGLLSATFTVQELQAATAVTAGTASIVPHSEFQRTGQQVYLGGSIDGTFTISELADIIAGASQVVSATDVQRFNRLGEQYIDNRGNIEELTRALDDSRKDLLKAGSTFQWAIDNFTAIKKRLDNLYQPEIDETPPAETPKDGDVKTENGVRYFWYNGAWREAG